MAMSSWANNGRGNPQEFSYHLNGPGLLIDMAADDPALDEMHAECCKTGARRDPSSSVRAVVAGQFIVTTVGDTYIIGAQGPLALPGQASPLRLGTRNIEVLLLQ